MVLGICTNCKKDKDVCLSGISEGLCSPCYKKLIWKRKLIKCRRCERMKPNHAKNLCPGCYNSVFQIEHVKLLNAKRAHNIEPELYKKIVQKCVICGFDKIIDLHHLDFNHNNNSEDNLIGLCPNHHKMIHHRNFQKEVFSILKDKGFQIPETYKDDEFFKQTPV